MSKDGNGSIPPVTIMDMFDKACREKSSNEVLFIERSGKWISWTWTQFYQESINFAKGLIAMNIPSFKTVNILGSNAPEWLFSFIGGIYACIIPVGIYITNNTETCMYIADHSECGCLVVDSIAQYRKYDVSKLPDLKVVVFYGEVNKNELDKIRNNESNVKLFLWNEFISLGQNSALYKELSHRIFIQKPGNCCNIVYTSGTTGFPKAVMLSHDNMTWTGLSFTIEYGYLLTGNNRAISYLPLSHIASQYNDIISKFNLDNIRNNYRWYSIILRKT
jgi:long-chain-fatty-acid--CoA ligase ACSBG